VDELTALRVVEAKAVCTGEVASEGDMREEAPPPMVPPATGAAPARRRGRTWLREDEVEEAILPWPPTFKLFV
jgi:hypothetical protein